MGDRPLSGGEPASRYHQAGRRPSRFINGSPHGEPAVTRISGCGLSGVRNAVEEARAANQPTVLCVSLAWAAGFISLSLGEMALPKTTATSSSTLAYKHGLRPFHAAGLCVRGSLAAKRGEPEVGYRSVRAGLAEMQEAIYLLFYPFFRGSCAALGSGSVDEGWSKSTRRCGLR